MDKNYLYFQVQVAHVSVAQIARQAKVLGARQVCRCLCCIGITFEEADFFISDFRRTGAMSGLYCYESGQRSGNRAYCHPYSSDSCRILAFDLGMHVLVILTDITNYAEA